MEPSVTHAAITVTGQVGPLFAALAIAQGKIGAVTKDRANKRLSNRYATLNAIREAALPVLADNGLALLQWSTVTDEGIARFGDNSGEYDAPHGVVTTYTLLCHKDGGTLQPAPMHIPWFRARGINTPQAIGIAITYGCRYSTTNLLGIAATDAEDNDGEHGTNDDAPVSVVQREPPKADRPLPPVTASPAEVAAYVKDYGNDMKWLKFLAVRANKLYPEGHALHDVWFNALGKRKEDLLAEEERKAGPVDANAQPAPNGAATDPPA